MKRRRPALGRDVSPAPFFSVATVLRGESPAQLLRTANSLRDQAWGNYQHIVVPVGRQQPATELLLDELAEQDRALVIRQRIGASPGEAENAALAVSRGPWLGLLRPGDELARSALARAARALRAHPETVLAYSDWRDATTGETFRKPDWSPERLRGQDYVSDWALLNTTEARRVDGFREGAGPAVIHDLLLRITESGGLVQHLPELLYIRHGAPGTTQEAWSAGRAAVAEHCARIGQEVQVELGAKPGLYRLERNPVRTRKISVIIPSRGSRSTVFGEERVLVESAVRSMLEHTDLVFEVVVVADEGVPQDYLARLRELVGHRLVVVPYSKPFNFSEKVNLGAAAASGDVLVFANDDIEITSDRWLEQMTALAEQNDVGLVGAILKFEDGTLQHGGHNYTHGNPNHAYYGETTSGYHDELLVDHEVSGATAALVACRHDVWWQVGGFTQKLPGNFNDVDFCLKIDSLGLRIVLACCVQAWHFESRTREPTVAAWEIDLMRSRWGLELAVDRFFRDPARLPI